MRLFKKSCWLLVFAAVLVLLLQPSVPDELRQRGLLFNEKLMHALLFALYYLVAVIAWGHPLYQFLLVFLFSLLTETLQMLTGRSFEWADLFANMLGALPIFLFFYVRLRLLNKYK